MANDAQPPQHLRALARAHAVRLEKAAATAALRSGELARPAAVDDPRAGAVRVGTLFLGGGGRVAAPRTVESQNAILARIGVPRERRLRDLTERQRDSLRAVLRAGEEAAANYRAPAMRAEAERWRLPWAPE